jgi:hypothetical protein
VEFYRYTGDSVIACGILGKLNDILVELFPILSADFEIVCRKGDKI